MYNVVDTKTGEIYGSFKAIDEASEWIADNCDVTEFYTWYGNIENMFYYNGNLITVVRNMTDHEKIEKVLEKIEECGFRCVPLEEAFEKGKDYSYKELIETLTDFNHLIYSIKMTLEDQD